MPMQMRRNSTTARRVAVTANGTVQLSSSTSETESRRSVQNMQREKGNFCVSDLICGGRNESGGFTNDNAVFVFLSCFFV